LWRRGAVLEEKWYGADVESRGCTREFKIFRFSSGNSWMVEPGTALSEGKVICRASIKSLNAFYRWKHIPSDTFA
jgi:hypothetical protein